MASSDRPTPGTSSSNQSRFKGDALEGSLGIGADVGILGIELATRRRNRVNGRVVDNGSGVITFGVEQSYGNCPQYIREREWRRVDDKPSGKGEERHPINRISKGMDRIRGYILHRDRLSWRGRERDLRNGRVPSRR